MKVRSTSVMVFDAGVPKRLSGTMSAKTAPSTVKTAQSSGDDANVTVGPPTGWAFSLRFCL